MHEELLELITFFIPILKSSILLSYKTNKPLWYKLLPAFQANCLATVFQSHTA